MLYPKMTATRTLTTLDGMWQFQPEKHVQDPAEPLDNPTWVAVPNSFNSSVGVSLKKTVLPPDGMTKLKVTIRKRDVGNKKHHLRILMITNDPLRPKVEINIKR